MAFQSRIFRLYCCGQVEESRFPFAAIGNGQAALGAMHAMHHAQALSWETLDSAMRASVDYSSLVHGPFTTHLLFPHGGGVVACA